MKQKNNKKYNNIEMTNEMLVMELGEVLIHFHKEGILEVEDIKCICDIARKIESIHLLKRFLESIRNKYILELYDLKSVYLYLNEEDKKFSVEFILNNILNDVDNAIEEAMQEQQMNEKSLILLKSIA